MLNRYISYSCLTQWITNLQFVIHGVPLELFLFFKSTLHFCWCFLLNICFVAVIFCQKIKLIVVVVVIVVSCKYRVSLARFQVDKQQEQTNSLIVTGVFLGINLFVLNSREGTEGSQIPIFLKKWVSGWVKFGASRFHELKKHRCPLYWDVSNVVRM